ncbi:Lysophospholipase L1 [Microbacterium sp. cf046]|uniref:SGNH/GDSL hydrolase family protein n=1 Tax=Microbacterium sp. cf046 TaxID=1761803 RepID=UPI0008E06644|nr:SGNH/GDSL hydrolase family protein [Microbacterium sp. cf046]SFS06938.1 Lysophospholipase L1 [Microbacterium sp. cf046]
MTLPARPLVRTIALIGSIALLLTACAPASGTASEDRPLVAFYGDSYTLGTGASDPSERWSTRISESRGWREFNPSRNGLGFVNNRDALRADLPGQIIDADPDIVIITMGLNDVFSYDRVGEGMREQIEDDFDRLRTALPDAAFVVVEPFWYTAERPDSLEVIIEWVRDAADDIGAEYVPGASSWIQGRRGEMAADGLHPNDEGYDLITQRIDAALRELGL